VGDLVNSGYGGIFSGRRVLITGDTGFKGSWLAFWLAELGAEVVGFALPPVTKLFGQLQLASRIKHYDGDLLDYDHWASVVDGFKPEIVFHLAAQAVVRRSYRDPRQTFSTNVMGSVHVLEALRECPTIKSVVFVTSDKCYSNKEWVWGYRESDELGGHDPYSASKACAELVFHSYVKSFFNERPEVGLGSVRAGNVIGGGDWTEDRIVPDCIRSILSGQEIVLRNPGATRPWQHVLEPLSGYLLLAAQLLKQPQKFSGNWNFGPIDSARSVADLVNRIIAVWGQGKLTLGQANGPHEAGLLQLNIDKARGLLDWAPRWNFEDTVNRTVEWYREAATSQDSVKITSSQIKAYCAKEKLSW